MKIRLFVLLMVVLGVSACNNTDYLIDGGVHSPNTNKTIYEYLKGHKYHNFDTLCMLIDSAGVRAEIDAEDITFIAVPDYAIRNFARKREAELRIVEDDENLRYTPANMIASRTEASRYADSLRMYIIKGKYNRAQLAKNKAYVLSEAGTYMRLELVETRLYTEYLPNKKPKLLVYTLIVNGEDDPKDANISVVNRDVADRCQTSGIIARNGILHVLNDDHVFSFRKN